MVEEVAVAGEELEEIDEEAAVEHLQNFIGSPSVAPWPELLAG